MKLFLRSIYLSAAILLSAFCASAFSTDSYTTKSALAEGRWVKVSVESTGMHLISASTLRQWGFSSPEKVRIHGYGGAMLPDVLSADTYIDDLPQVPAVATWRGIYFYAVGPAQISLDGDLTHSVNPYSSAGYYFLTDAAADSPLPAIAASGTPDDGLQTPSVVKQMVVHEQELNSPGNSGRMMTGEDFNATRSRNFTVQLPGKVGDDVKLRTSFVANTPSTPSQLTFTVNGTPLATSTSDRIGVTSGDGFWGTQILSKRDLEVSGDRLFLTIAFTNSGVVKSANLDYFEVIYSRELSGSMDYFTDERHVCHQGAEAQGVHVWDVTDPMAVTRVNVGAHGGWDSGRPQGTPSHYAVWSETDAMPTPKRVGEVRPQNLHGMTEVPDMVIITPDVYLNASNTVANLHRNSKTDPLKVEVVSLDRILNEFGSGAFDPGAVRRFLKMLYDRGEAAGTPLRYALMMGKGTCDNRRLTAVGRALRSPMPLWVSEASLNESSSYSSDDYFALLSDNDGTRPGRETLNIAVGRIPATTADEAKIAADKIRQYMHSMPMDGWRTRLTVLADDENQGQHMTQSEKMLSNLEATSSGSRFVINKVYCDAFPRKNSTYPRAKEILFGDFADGMSIFAFVGHGSPTALGSKMIIGPTEFRDKFHLRRLPFFYAATCSFLHWDSDITSQAESLMFQADGGLIGCISALRPVYITQNGNLTAAFGTTLGETDADGKVLTMGEVYRRAKNRVNNDTNKMRYVLMADPALRLLMPSATVELDAINGVNVSAESPATVMARQKLTLTGRIVNPDGSLMSDFNGSVYATLYDADYSTTSRGHGEGEEVTFEQKGDMLFSVCGIAANGEFTISVQMPSALADNYRPATMSLYATGNVADNASAEAAGMCRDIYAFGYDETSTDDLEPPVIHSMTLNGDSFTDGTDVNPSPLLRATVSDNIGLNLATAGVGRRMSLMIDDKETLMDLNRYFVPDAIPIAGAMSGTINYPMSNLSEGAHELRLRVWDIDGNFTDKTIACNVVSTLAPEIFEVYTDASPARTEANFYVKHNRPDQILKVKVSVYNLLGAPIWSGETQAQSNMGISTPVTWNLRDDSGKRVRRGIYVYRAEVTTDGSSISTASCKMAVSGE